MTEVRTRFAPSPTGFLHIGGARTALFSWLYARSHSGKFILRIEDTDSSRSTEDSVETILDGLAWLGIDYDEGPFYQLDNLPRHQKAARQLLEEGKAYHCYCTEEELAVSREQQRAKNEKPRYDRRCRDRIEPRSGVKPTIRFKTPLDGSVAFEDAIHGKIEVQNSELDDLVLIRSDGTPTYNFSAVLDDMDSGITHIIRGDDHINNTPRQIHLLQALSAEMPIYAHLPMILDAQGKRLSKRAGAASVTEYREAGYLPEAVLNYLLRLGWSYGDQELFSIREMFELFDLKHIGKTAASLNPGKLDWLNRHYLREADLKTVGALFSEHLEQAGYVLTSAKPSVEKAFDALCDRYKNLRDMAEGAAFLYSDIHYDPAELSKRLKPEIKFALALLCNKMEESKTWNSADIKRIIDGALAESGSAMKQLGPAVRFAVTGGAASPDLPSTLELVGQEQSISRIKQAIRLID